MSKRILLLGNHGFVIYNFRKELIKKLLEYGFEVHISLPNDDKVQTMVEWGCNFTETNIDGRGTNPITDLKLILHYVRILKKIKPDVVLAYTIKPNLYGGLACRLLQIPCINTITGLGSGFKKESILRSFLSFMYKLSLKKSACVFFQNTEDMKKLLDSNTIKGQYELIPGSGVNLSEFMYKDLPEEGKEITFIFIGRIMKDKGIDQFLDAAKIVKQKYPNTRFNVIGYVESSQPHYNDIINQYEKDGYINYHGYQKVVKPFIEEAHCLIQPSHGGEGLSNVLLETAAIGRALIASDIPGCRETTIEDYNGYTFEAKRTHNLIEKIEGYINLPYMEKVQMGKNSRKKVEIEFDRNIVVNEYMKKIKHIFNQKVSRI